MQIRFSAQFHQPPLRKLTPQRSPKPLPVFEPRAPAVCVAIGWIRQIDQRQGSGASAEALDDQLQPPAPLEMDSPGPPYQVSSRAPAFEGNGGPTAVDLERLAADGERIRPRLHQDRLLTGFEKALNGQVRLVRISARDLTGGRLQ